MTKCIYCLEYKPETSYKKTEHVIPQSFGVFKNNFTLNRVVCDDCNKYFGDNLEIDLARDTYEGHSRFEFNVKDPYDYKSYGKRSRLLIRIVEGPLKGIFVCREYSANSNNIILKPIPQVGFKKPDLDEYEYYLFNEFPEKKYLEENNFDLTHPHGIRAFGIDIKILESKLSEKGISFNPGGEYLPPNTIRTLLCEVEGTIDRKIFRAISKIGFNYLTYWQGSDFMYQGAFDTIRRYIRYGVTSYPLVGVLNKPILADENRNKRRLGHIVTVNWAEDKVSIVSQVSLFNWATYRLCLSREYSGERRNIKKGHFFNTNNKEILELETR
ncbi:MAG: HNH endonuclease [Thermodesulfovibrionales bacterium]